VYKNTSEVFHSSHAIESSILHEKHLCCEYKPRGEKEKTKKE
jgi:hypothetical protein